MPNDRPRRFFVLYYPSAMIPGFLDRYERQTARLERVYGRRKGQNSERLRVTTILLNGPPSCHDRHRDEGVFPSHYGLSDGRWVCGMAGSRNPKQSRWHNLNSPEMAVDERATRIRNTRPGKDCMPSARPSLSRGAGRVVPWGLFYPVWCFLGLMAPSLVVLM